LNWTDNTNKTVAPPTSRLGRGYCDWQVAALVNRMQKKQRGRRRTRCFIAAALKTKGSPWLRPLLLYSLWSLRALSWCVTPFPRGKQSNVSRDHPTTTIAYFNKRQRTTADLVLFSAAVVQIHPALFTMLLLQKLPPRNHEGWGGPKTHETKSLKPVNIRIYYFMSSFRTIHGLSFSIAVGNNFSLLHIITRLIAMLQGQESADWTQSMDGECEQTESIMEEDLWRD